MNSPQAVNSNELLPRINYKCKQQVDKKGLFNYNKMVWNLLLNQEGGGKMRM